MEMANTKNGKNTLCVAGFLLVLLGLGLFCILRKSAPRKPSLLHRPRPPSETKIRTVVDPVARAPAEDNIELIASAR